MLHRIAQLAGTGNVRKSGGKFATGKLGESTERTQIPHLRSRHSWERDRARRAAGGESARGEREGRACEEALRGTRRPAYAPEAAMPRGAAHMPGSLRARGLVPEAGSREPAASLGAEPEGTPAPCSTSHRSGASSCGAAKTPREGVSQGLPRLRLRGLASSTCTRGRWGGEVRAPVPAAGRLPARPPIPPS